MIRDAKKKPELDPGGEGKKEEMREMRRARGSLSAYMSWPLLVCIGLLILSIAVTAIDWLAGGVASLISIAIVIGLAFMTVIYYRRITSDMVSYGAGYAQIQKALLKEMTIPYAVSDDRGMLVWMNPAFAALAGPEVRLRKSINQLSPGLTQHLLKDDQENSVFHVEYGDKRLEIQIRRVSMDNITDDVLGSEGAKPAHMFGIYLQDETQMIVYKERLEDEMLVAALIYLDNYDEVMDSVEDVRRSLFVALIDRQINKYISAYSGVIKRLENDKYFAIFTYGHLKQMQEDRFSIVESVKEINIGNTTPVTISIGLGLHGEDYAKNYEYARTAIDMALGRGGDQVVLKDQDNITYYGGKTQNQGKTTRVKARVKAQTLRELIETMDNVLIMGHRISDADCIGAAMGIYRAASYSGKKAQIVLDTISTNIRPLIERFKGNPDYEEDLFINNETALSKMGRRTLLVVVDNNRPSHSECPELLKGTENVVVIDHHRQAKDYIDNTLLSYVEPYASSASEMVAEILQYYGEDIRIRPTDAEAMYSGIMVDTNNFLNKTGVRTFEAAAFLRRCGADVTRVRKLFRDEMDDYRAKAEIVRNVEIYKQCYAISVCPSGITSSPTVISSQAANEMLGVRNIKASFVLTDYDHQIYISARSIDELNVQIIMEKLGGGGHLSMAGAQLKDCSIEEGIARLKAVLDATEAEELSNKVAGDSKERRS